MAGRLVRSAARRRIVPALCMAAGAAAVQAQPVDITPLAPATALACLQMPPAAVGLATDEADPRDGGLVRVKLRFTAPDAPPAAELLAATARADLQRLVQHHVADYRLPCLQPGEPPVEAVQDFVFRPAPARRVTRAEPVPLAGHAPRPPACLLRPAKDPAPVRGLGRRALQHVVFSLRFEGDGSQPPQVRLLHSSVTPADTELLLDWAQGYRMPCRTAGDAPTLLREHFMLGARDMRRYAFSKDSYGLTEFLAMTEQPERLQGWFDFTTMRCPFKVAYTVWGPALPNEVRSAPPLDPNRLPFMQWLQRQQLHFADDRQANDLFGRTVLVEVPCAVLDLQP
ncbi:hypothetical protein [Pseudorhodoferax sp.]|uniref:hypothetical protein n=1 Tax=Pseudorhodoferax sp. TaxID=1993553 RepID=UPI0039E4D831